MVTPQGGDFHHPYKLERDFDKKYKQAMAAAKDGLPAKDVCVLVFGITERQFDTWKKMYTDDVENDFTASDSNLIKLFDGLRKNDVNLHRNLSKTAIEMAIEDRNPNMTQFLLKTKYGYSEKNATDVNVNVDEDSPIKFEIVDMTPNDEEE